MVYGTYPHGKPSRPAPWRDKHEGLHVLERQKENGIFLQTISTCESRLVRVFLRQHVST